MARVNADTDLWLAGIRYQSALTSVVPRREVELKDATTFASGGTRANRPGLVSYGLTVAGFWDDDLDAALQGLVGRGGVRFAAIGPGQAAAWVGTAVGGAATLFGGAVGDMLGQTLDLAAGEPPDFRRAAHLRTRESRGLGAASNTEIPNPDSYESVHVQATRTVGTRQFNARLETRDAEADPWDPGDVVPIFEGAELGGAIRIPMNSAAGTFARVVVTAAGGAGATTVGFAVVAARS